MPSFRDSINVDTSRLAGVGIGGGSGAISGAIGGPPAEPVTARPVSTLDSSLPVLASGSDLYTRQFYNRGGMPQRRFLPIAANRQ